MKLLLLLICTLVLYGLSACGTEAEVTPNEIVSEFNGLRLPEHEHWSYQIDGNGLLQVVSEQEDFNDTNININFIGNEGFEGLDTEFRFMGVESSFARHDNVRSFQAFDVPDLGVPARALSYFMNKGNTSYDCINFVIDYQNNIFVFTYMQPMNDDFEEATREDFVSWIQSFEFNE